MKKFMHSIACAFVVVNVASGARKTARTVSQQPGKDNYFDCNAGSGGDGSQGSPFRDLTAISPSSFQGMYGVSMNLKRGCSFSTSSWTDLAAHTFTSITGFTLTSYGSGATPVVVGSHMGKKGKCMVEGDKNCTWHYAFSFNDVSDLSVSNIHFKDAPLFITPKFAETATGFSFDNCDFTGSRHEAVHFESGGRELLDWQKKNYRFKNIKVSNCRFRNNAYHNFRVLGKFHYTDTQGAFSENIVVKDSLFEYTTSAQGAGVVVSSSKDVLIENNLFNYMNGSGYWSVRTHRATVRNNFFANFARSNDACTNHVDLGNFQTLFHHNVGYNNEGGFLEVLGYSNSTWSKFSVSINDGIDLSSNGAKAGGASVFMHTGFSGGKSGVKTPRQNGEHTYVTNNLIVSKVFQLYKFLDNPKKVNFVNNIIYTPWSQKLQVKFEGWNAPNRDTNSQRLLQSTSFVGGAADAGLNSLQSAFTWSRKNGADQSVTFDPLVDSLVQYMKHVLSVPLGKITPSEIRQGICKRLAVHKKPYTAAMNVVEASVPWKWKGDSGFDSMRSGEADGASVSDFCGRSNYPFVGPAGNVQGDECRLFCFDHPPAWYCDFANCKGCSACQPRCENWCSENSGLTKCSWKACVGCPGC